MTVQVQRASAQGASSAANAGLASFNSANFTVDANGFVSASGAGTTETLTGNSGGAVSPTAGNINTVGTGSITIVGNPGTSTLTTQLTGLTNHDVLVGAGTATITSVSPSTAGFILTSNGVAADPSFQAASASGAITTITGNSGGAEVPLAGNFNILGTGSITVAGTANTETVQLTGLTNHSLLVGAGTPTITNLGVATNGQLPIGSTGANPVLGNITSSGGTITVTNGAGTINLDLAGGGEAIDSIGTQTGTNPIVPTGAGLVTINGAVVAAGTNPVRSDGTGANTMAIEVQISQALAATDATKIGLSNFDSSAFAVDANGFVTLSTTGALRTLSGDTGTATPIAGNIQLIGGPGVTTVGVGATVTINSVIFTDTAAATLAVDNGYFATAAGTYPLPATAVQGEMLIVVCDTAGAVVLDAPALNFIRIGSLITSSGGTATSTSIGDSLTLRYRLSSLTWEATSVIGTWIIA